MSHHLRFVRVPDGKIAIWDTQDCCFIHFCSTDEEIIEAYVAGAVKKLKELAERELRWFRENEKKEIKPNYFMTFREALEQLELVHGKKERDFIWNYIGKIQVKESE